MAGAQGVVEGELGRGAAAAPGAAALVGVRRAGDDLGDGEVVRPGGGAGRRGPGPERPDLMMMMMMMMMVMMMLMMLMLMKMMMMIHV